LNKQTTLAIAIALMVVLILSVIVTATATTEAKKSPYKKTKPYYVKGDGKIKYKAIVTNDCWKSLYLRLTPRLHNMVLLNFQYTYNNSPSDSEKDYAQSGQLKFKTFKIERATKNDTDSAEIRMYATWRLTTSEGELYEGTDTQYIDYVQGKTSYTLPRPFVLNPDIHECQEDR